MTLITLKGGAQVSMRPQDISIELQKFEKLKSTARKIREQMKRLDINTITYESFEILNDVLKKVNELFISPEIDLMTRG